MPVYPVTFVKTVECYLEADTWEDAQAVADNQVDLHSYTLDHDFGCEGWAVESVGGEINEAPDSGIGEEGEIVHIDDAVRGTFEYVDPDACEPDDPRQCRMLAEA